MFGEIFAAPSQQEAQQEAEQKLAKIQTKIQKSQKKIEKDRGDRWGNLKRSCVNQNGLLEALNQELKVTETKLADTRKQLQDLESQKQDLLGKLSKHRSILYSQIRSEYSIRWPRKIKVVIKPTGAN